MASLAWEGSRPWERWCPRRPPFGPPPCARGIQRHEHVGSHSTSQIPTRYAHPEYAVLMRAWEKPASHLGRSGTDGWVSVSVFQAIHRIHRRKFPHQRVLPGWGRQP